MNPAELREKNVLSLLRSGAAEPQCLRLSSRDESALRFLFNDFDGIGGLRSSHGAQIDALLNPRSGGPATATIVVDGVRCGIANPERWALQFPKDLRDSVARMYRATKAMAKSPRGQEHLAVLWAYYGPRRPGAEQWVPPEEAKRNGTGLGALTPVAQMTPTAQRLAAEATERARRAHAEVQLGADVQRIAVAEAAEVATRALHDHADEALRRDPPCERAVQLKAERARTARRIAKLQGLQRSGLESSPTDVVEQRAAKMRFEVSACTALAQAMSIHGKSKEARANAVERRKTLLRTLRIESERLLVRASSALSAALREGATS